MYDSLVSTSDESTANNRLLDMLRQVGCGIFNITAYYITAYCITAYYTTPYYITAYNTTTSYITAYDITNITNITIFTIVIIIIIMFTTNITIFIIIIILLLFIDYKKSMGAAGLLCWQEGEVQSLKQHMALVSDDMSAKQTLCGAAVCMLRDVLLLLLLLLLCHVR
jgi:hypothetical protein